MQPSNRFHSGSVEKFIDENGNDALLEEVTMKDHPLFNKNIAPLRDHNWKKKNDIKRGLEREKQE